MKNVELKHLRLIKHIVDGGSMSNATHKMFLTQSALSHMLREFEENLGVKIFARRGKKLHLTDQGNTILFHAEKVLSEFSELEKAVANFKDAKAERIKISTACYTSYHWLPAVVKLFREKTPEVMIDIVIEATQKPLSYLENGKLDIAITDSKPLVPSRYRTDFLFEDVFLLLVAKNSPYLRSEPFTAGLLNGEVLFIYEMQEDMSTAFTQFIRPNGIELAAVTKMQLTEGLIEMVAAGLGVTIMPCWMASPYLKQGKVKAIKLPGARVSRKWYAVSHKDATKEQELFIDLLQRELKHNFNSGEIVI
ncbi:LysR family transcriptional regulator [Olivibacter sp. SDN3]|uniref:LysR family transcriptional regulator n=1 Tax=Olivibacter sp. SDN3 TaxID=2764720 RepID=UPI0016510381|nr:LysR family transcriptional regulator [Olivibacter sp. SDN3]QNL50960.1 LysR family transcriptional regulator [Olivibacter sp. SDN3]